MNKDRIKIILAGGLMVCGLSGCALFNKGSVQYTRTTTVGQEIMDLQQARDQNAITEEEYNDAKKEILKLVNED
ncbi:MAG: SHOCT domain-containing protein [Lentisphaerae bacterium]|jgi:hypothetical protein|nr:SHOCT domain-containing protein [Lentisphaerota bacterium]